MTVSDRGTAAWMRARLANERRRSQAAAASFISAIRSADGPALLASTGAMQHTFDGWSLGLGAAGKLTGVTDASRRVFLDFWVEVGDSIRNESPGDLVLIRALRALLPPYRGVGLRLYRGEGARNRRRRTYGMSWSASKTVAYEFASLNRRFYQGGTYVLESEVPADAIICAPSVEGGENGNEHEYVVDRRFLGRVRVLERFGALPPEIEPLQPTPRPSLRAPSPFRG